MIITAKRAAEICREWYVAFRNMGKGEEKCVLELLDVADTIEALKAAQQKWISVDERPPELPCICYDGLNPPRELDAMYRLSIEERELYYSYDVFNLMDILSDETDISEPIDIGSMTHILFWMPLPSMPEPPKEDA